MSFAEFEEKEFEGAVNAQLGGGAGPIWTPGQVLEKVVGFDVAMMTYDAVFWAIHGFSAPPPGDRVLPRWWRTAPVKLPPRYRTNLFVQYKRPEYLASRRSTEWATWQRAYFRFRTSAHQQSALDACARALGKNGLVAYASPAFHKREDLFLHIERRTLVANTHFAPSRLISRHGRYTYVDARARGKAHSTVVEIEPLIFVDADGRGGGVRTGHGDDDGGIPPGELFAAARRAAQAAVQTTPSLVGNREVFAAAVERGRTFVAEVAGDLAPQPRQQLLVDFVYAATFSSMSGIGWSIAQ